MNLKQRKGVSVSMGWPAGYPFSWPLRLRRKRFGVAEEEMWIAGGLRSVTLPVTLKRREM